MGVKVYYNDVVITEVKIGVKIWCEIGGTARDKENVNVMNVGGNIIDGGCNGEVISDGERFSIK